jgi:hypothetical protein
MFRPHAAPFRRHRAGVIVPVSPCRFRRAGFILPLIVRRHRADFIVKRRQSRLSSEALSARFALLTRTYQLRRNIRL